MRYSFFERSLRKPTTGLRQPTQTLPLIAVVRPKTDSRKDVNAGDFFDGSLMSLVLSFFCAVHLLNRMIGSGAAKMVVASRVPLCCDEAVLGGIARSRPNHRVFQ